MSGYTAKLSTQSPKHHQWFPPTGLRRYQWYKAVGSLLMVLIFGGWVILQWSNTPMRLLSFGMIAVTGWVLIRSALDDDRRARGRQVTLTDGMMAIKTPKGVTDVCLEDVAMVWWLEGSQEATGLWFYDRHKRPIAHLDSGFLTDQSEARSFLGWAKRHVDLNFNVRWPG